MKSYSGAASGVSVVGVDPNRKMEKYAQAAAESSGLHETNSKFIQVVCVYMSIQLYRNMFIRLDINFLA